MARRAQSLLAEFLELPWWTSVLAAGAAYGVVAFGVPLFVARNPAMEELGIGLSQSAWMFGMAFLLPAPMAAYGRYRRRKLLDGQCDLASILQLGWRDFESLVVEIFHRQGYSVAQKGGASPDSGIDIVLNRSQERVLVQCKHWRARMVGVAPVRELLGVMSSERASSCMLVTSGSFSDDAHDFASGNPIELIDGRRLEQMVRTARIGLPKKNVAAPSVSISVSCPECGSRMVKRLARKGIIAGTSFWGCSRFPTCSGVRQIA